MDGSHPESPARISAIREKITASGLLKTLQQHDAPAATDAQLQRVHSAEYVRHIRAVAPPAGKVRLDPDTSMGPMSLSAALHAAGAVVLGVDLVMSGKVQNAFCCVRPPGHHAGRAHSAGFCIFNSVAVGAAHAIAQYGIRRAAIIDFDVHHGDGTEDIFKDNPKVMLCSTFQHPFYPHRGADTRTERMVNVPLKAGTDGKAFRAAVESEFAPALEKFKPEFIFISAGFDAHRDDPLAGLNLVREDYIRVTHFILEVANKHAQGRVVSALEGGYDLNALANSAEAHIRTLAGM
jgi:acetoin utilization deacetylase AcuC-like enzyme